MDQATLIAEIERKKLGFERANEVRRKALKERTHEKWLHGLHGLFMVREPGISLFDDAAALQQALTEDGVAFCFIGGVALQHWGEVRQTTDLDLNVYCELGRETDVLAVLMKHLAFRDEEASRDFQTHRVFFGRTPNNYEVDIFVGYTPFEKRITERSVSQNYGLMVPLRICSAEDLVITKTVAGRGQDWVDIDRIIQRSGETMNWPLVFEELERLLALYGEEDHLPRLKAML
ncbi:MAG: hypothetical protein RIE53_09255 [Rhodothermales bacterium]